MTNLLAAVLIVVGLLLFCALCAGIMLLFLIWRIARGFERTTRVAAAPAAARP